MLVFLLSCDNISYLYTDVNRNNLIYILDIKQRRTVNQTN